MKIKSESAIEFTELQDIERCLVENGLFMRYDPCLSKDGTNTIKIEYEEVLETPMIIPNDINITTVGVLRSTHNLIQFLLSGEIKISKEKYYIYMIFSIINNISRLIDFERRLQYD